MNKKHIAITITISAAVTVLQCLISLIITPLVTNSVGVEAYGFVTLAKNFTNYANILMIALNSYATRYITIAYLKNDRDAFQKYYSTVYIADLVIGGVILLIGIVFIFFIERILNAPIELIEDVKILFLLTFISFFLTTLTTVFVSSSYVKDKLEVYNSIKVVAYFIQAATLIICFKLLNSRVWYVGIALSLTSFTILVGSYLMTRKYLPEAKIKIRDFDTDSFKTLTKNGVWNSVNSLGNALNSGLDLLITNLMLTVVGMGQMSVAKTISSLVASFYSVLGTPFQPLLLKHYSNENKDALLSVLKESMQCCGIVTNVIFAGFVSIGLDFLNLWIPNQDTCLIYLLCVLALLPAISEGCAYPLYYIYTLTVKNKVPCFVTIIGGLTNIGTMYILIKFTNLGLYAVLITTAVIMNFINLVTNPLYMAHCLRMKKFIFYPQILRNIISCAAATGAMKFVSSFLPGASSWILLAFDISLLCLIGVIIQIPIQFRLSEIKPISRKVLNKIITLTRKILY